MDETIKKLKTKKGYSRGNKDIQIFYYADDVVLFADGEDDLQLSLYLFSMAT